MGPCTSCVKKESITKTRDVNIIYEKKFGSTKSTLINDSANGGLKRVPILKKV